MNYFKIITSNKLVFFLLLLKLESNKRYSLKFAPMKKIERPKVNREAIAAQLKKKEEEEQKKGTVVLQY